MARRTLIAPRIATTFLSVVLASCLADQTAPEIGLSLRVVSGDAQRGPAGRELPDPLVVQVTDARGRGMRDQLVNFVVTAGGGSVFAGTAITDRDGFAQEYWTLGTVAGVTNRLEVRAVDPTSGAKQVFAAFTAVADPAAAASIAVTPETATIMRDATVQLSATMEDEFGNAITDRDPVWQSRNEAVAQVSPSGLVTGIGAGTVYVVGSMDGVADSARVTVLVVGSVTIAPSPVNVDLLETVQLTATVRATNGVVIPGAVVMWESVNPAVASVSASGLARGEEGGSTQIRAISEGVAGTVNVTVAVPVDTVVVSPATVSFPAGETRAFTAQPLDAKGRSVSGPIAWSSSNLDVVRVVSSSGGSATAQGWGAGQAQVRATSGGVTGFAVVTVTALPGDQWEFNNTSGSATNFGNLNEGSTRTEQGTIHVTGDRDWFRVHALEGGGACFPGANQDFRFTVTLTGIPAGRDYDLAVYVGSPGGTRWSSANGSNSNETVSLTWDGTCGLDDSFTFYVEVYWFSGAPSVQPYALTMRFVQE